MKVCPRTRQMAATVVSLIALLGVVGFIQSSALSSQAQSSLASSEVGFSSLSPRGASGGAIIPASCESGLGEGGVAHFQESWDFYGDGRVPDPVYVPGDTSGSCLPGTADIKANGSNGPIII